MAPGAEVRRPVLARILAVIVASAVVAAAASGVGLLVPAAQVSGAWPWAVRLGGAVAAGCGLAVLLRSRPRSGRNGRTNPAISAVATAATIMTALAVLALLAPRASVVDGSAEELATLEQLEEPGSDPFRPQEFRPVKPGRQPGYPATGEDDSPGGQGFGSAVRRNGFGGAADTAGGDWRFGVLLLGILLAVAALIGMLVWRRAHSRTTSAAESSPVSAAEAEAGLESSLEEVSYEGPDPRRQVTAAYLRLLSALAEAGAPRAPQEAPHEHLHRVLGPLGVPAAPMHRLAELYVIAQFSTRALTDRHRSAAAEALERALASLRAEHRSSSDSISGKSAA